MAEHRAVIGGVLLTVAAAAWIAAPTTVATGQDQSWSSPIVLGFMTAGGLCLIAALGVFAAPARLSPTERKRQRNLKELGKLKHLGDSYAAKAAQMRTTYRNDPLMGSIRMRLLADQKVNAWFDETWAWVERERPDLVIYLTPIQTPIAVPATESLPALIEKRLKELTDVSYRIG